MFRPFNIHVFIHTIIITVIYYLLYSYLQLRYVQCPILSGFDKDWCYDDMGGASIGILSLTFIAFMYMLYGIFSKKLPIISIILSLIALSSVIGVVVLVIGEIKG